MSGYCTLWGLAIMSLHANKKTQSTRSLASYAIISTIINLTDSAQNMVRRLGSRDPKEVCNALLVEFDQTTPATKMALLDFVLDLPCTSSVLVYVSDF